MTPDDLRGAGRVQQLHDPLGDVGLYIERFAGDDDLAGQLESIAQSADAITALVGGWFKHELGDDERWPALDTFIMTQFRRDVYNLGLYFWAGRAADESESTLARLGLYLIEHDYIEPGQLPQLVAMFNPSPLNQHAAGSGAKHVQRLVTRRMKLGDNQPIPASLEFLSTPDRASESFRGWYRTTDLYERQLAAWKAQNPDKADDEMPFNLSEEALGPIGDVIGLRIFEPNERVELSMHDAPNPLYTNGQFDAEKSQLQWAQRIDQKLTPPAVFYLVWARPNADAQKKHFGQVVLDGDRLMQYVTWRAGLDDDLRKQWDDFVKSLAPGDSLADKLDTFRFMRDGKVVIDEKARGAELLTIGLDDGN
jgi:hypothetical protein